MEDQFWLLAREARRPVGAVADILDILMRDYGHWTGVLAVGMVKSEGLFGRRLRGVGWPGHWGWAPGRTLLGFRRTAEDCEEGQGGGRRPKDGKRLNQERYSGFDRSHPVCLRIRGTVGQAGPGPRKTAGAPVLTKVGDTVYQTLLNQRADLFRV